MNWCARMADVVANVVNKLIMFEYDCEKLNKMR